MWNERQHKHILSDFLLAPHNFISGFNVDKVNRVIAQKLLKGGYPIKKNDSNMIFVKTKGMVDSNPRDVK